MHVRSLARTALIATLASAIGAVTPWASAAENRLPDRPSTENLITGPVPCDVTQASVLGDSPSLFARLDDPDGDQLTAQFEVAWNDADGTPHRLRGSTGPEPSGIYTSWEVPDSVPRDTVVQWRVRAYDGLGYGPWSDSDQQGTCLYTVPALSPPVAAWRLDDPSGSAYAAAWAGPYRGLGGPGVQFGATGPNHVERAAAYLDGGPAGDIPMGGGVVDPTRAFTAGVWVAPDATGRDMAALSQTGGLDSTPGFTLGATTGADGKPAWGFTLPSADGRTRITAGTPKTGQWTYLAGAYDPATGTARLYVDGALAATGEAAVPADTLMSNFLIGADSDGYTVAHTWQGSLADVRVWDRDVTPAEIAALSHARPRPANHWQMQTVKPLWDGLSGIPEADDHADLVLHGDAHVTTEDPLAGSGDVTLDGAGDYLESDVSVMDSSASWAVSAKVRLHGVPDRDMAVLSQAGVKTDAFTLRYHAADRTWHAVLAHADEAEPATTELGGPAPDGTATLLLQYDARAGAVQLYVDGTLADSAPYAAADAWEAWSYFQVGRDSAADGAGAHYLDGDVDELRTWEGALSAEEAEAAFQDGEGPAL
ncbi:LamG domain-containing protein [Streptomyces sp. NPDC048106]|uniref:LamG domain-containing protein n=1 Tax=Streptomyces sp. NPDC048106 TaxID=3155750 RepID=UPI003455051F